MNSGTTGQETIIVGPVRLDALESVIGPDRFDRVAVASFYAGQILSRTLLGRLSGGTTTEEAAHDLVALTTVAASGEYDDATFAQMASFMRAKYGVGEQQ